MPQIERVRELSEPSERSQAQERLDPEATGASTPPAMISAAPTTGMVTSDPGYAVWALKANAA